MALPRYSRQRGARSPAVPAAPGQPGAPAPSPVLVSAAHDGRGQAELLADGPGLRGAGAQQLVLCRDSGRCAGCTGEGGPAADPAPPAGHAPSHRHTSPSPAPPQARCLHPRNTVGPAPSPPNPSVLLRPFPALLPAPASLPRAAAAPSPSPPRSPPPLLTGRALTARPRRHLPRPARRRRGGTARKARRETRARPRARGQPPRPRPHYPTTGSDWRPRGRRPLLAERAGGEV